MDETPSEEVKVETPKAEEPKGAKVFSLRSRREIDPDELANSAGEVIVEGDEGPEPVLLTKEGLLPPCIDTTAAAQKFVDQSQEGLLQGFMAVAWNQKFGTFDRVILLPKVKPEQTVMMMHAYLGALKMLTDDLSAHIADCLSPELDEDFEDDE